MSLTHSEARTLIDAAAVKAEELGANTGMAVLDAGGRPICVDQFDGARPHRDRVAKGKALAAIIVGQDTDDAKDMREANPSRYQALQTMFAGEIYLTGGGILLVTGGEIVGAMGIAGGQQGEDAIMARAGIAVWREKHDRPE